MSTQQLIEDASERLKQASALIGEARRSILFAMSASDLAYAKHRPLEKAFNRLKVLEPKTATVAKAIDFLAMLP